MKVIGQRGANTFLVNLGDRFALVNLETKSVNYSKFIGAFLKFGYFKDPVITDDIINDINKLLY